jgi:hypothetical protein
MQTVKTEEPNKHRFGIRFGTTSLLRKLKLCTDYRTVQDKVTT